MLDSVIPGFLGRALSLEMSAVQQYLSLGKIVEMRGMQKAAEQFRHEAREEMQHAERIIGRMLALGFAPNASHLKPARLDGSLTQLMEHVSAMERDIVSFYAHAVDYCRRIKDVENRMFFEALLAEEQAHAGSIEQWNEEIESGKYLFQFDKGAQL